MRLHPALRLPVLLVVFALVACGYRLAGKPTVAFCAGLPVLIPIDAGPEQD